MKATLQALQTLPEENFLVLRFLTAFLVQVGLGAGLSARLEWGWGALLLDLGVGAGGRVCGFRLQRPLQPRRSSCRSRSSLTRTR